MNYKITTVENGYFIDARIYRNGKSKRQRETVIGTSKKAAERRAFQIVQELEERLLNEQANNSGYFTTFAECSDYYKIHNPLSKGSVSTFELNYKRFEHCTVEDMPAQIEHFNAYLKSTPTRLGTPRSPATINRHQVWVMIVLNYAADWEKIEKNPIKKLRKEKEPKSVNKLHEKRDNLLYNIAITTKLYFTQ